MNNKPYSVAPDNLLRGAAHPLDMRIMTIKNPKCGLNRGALIKADASGDYFVAGAVDAESAPMTGDVVSILGHNVAADTDNETVSVAAYVSGGFHLSAVSGVNGYEPTESDILSAQKYGLYIHS